MEKESSEYRIPLSRQVAIVSNMTALALLGNYSLASIPNVEFASVVIFITALVFGSKIGTWCALSTSIIYASINPWGPFIPQIWVTQLIGWVYVDVAGSMISKKMSIPYERSAGPKELFIIGVVLTLIFDLVTNMGYSLVFNVPYYLAIILGLPFMLVHTLSNGIIMAIAVPEVELILKKHLASIIWDPPISELELVKKVE